MILLVKNKNLKIFVENNFYIIWTFYKIKNLNQKFKKMILT